MKKITRVLIRHALIFTALALYAAFGKCPLFALFHIPCPMCGITRAGLAFVRGDFGAAFALHPLLLLFPAAVLFFSHYSILQKRWGKRICIAIAAAIVLAFLIAHAFRNRQILLEPQNITFLLPK